MKKDWIVLLLGVSLHGWCLLAKDVSRKCGRKCLWILHCWSDPCILADRKTAMYYMTGTGGMF